MTHEYTHPTTSGVRHHSSRTRAVGTLLVLLLTALCLWPAHAPAQPATDTYWPVTRRHTFARDSGNNLIMYLESLTDPDSWQPENLSARFPTRFASERLGIAGTPRPVGAWNPVRGDVFGRNADGELVHYWWLGGEWHAENLTSGPHAALPRPPLTANPIFSGDPEAVVSHQDGYLRHDVFARSSAGQLVHYWWSAQPPSGWRAENLTLVTAGPAIVGTPDVVVGSQDGYLRHDVFARNSVGQLVHYWWSAQPPSGWRAENLTSGPHAALPHPPLTANPIFSSDPEAVVGFQDGYLRHDVFARNSAGQLVHYWWSAQPPSGWRAENLTLVTAGPTIVGAPDVVVGFQDGYLRHDVFARNSAGQLVHYWNYCAPPCTWQVENLTTGPHAALPQPPLTANPTFTSDPVVVASSVYYYSSPDVLDSYLSHDVFARNSDGQLIQYNQLLSGWEASNPTLTASGPPIAGNPAVMKSESNDHRD